MSDEVINSGGVEQVTVGIPEVSGIEPSESRDAAIEAVEAAIAAEEAGASVEEAVEAATKPKSKEAPADPELMNTSQLKKLLAARESKVRATQEAARLREEGMREVMAERAKNEAIAAQLKAQAQYLQKLKSDPEAALQALGLDPEEFLTGIARSASPEAKLQAQLRAQREEVQRVQARLDAELKQREEYQRQAAIAQEEQMRQGVYSQFMQLVDGKPYTKAMYGNKPEFLKNWGDDIANMVYEKAGRYPTLEEIAEYIEEQSESSYHSVQLKSDKGGNQVTGRKPTQSAKAAKTLGHSDASEKRTLSRSTDNLSDAERRLAAREAVELAIAQEEANNS